MILFLTSSPCLEGSGDINPANHFASELRRTVKPNARGLFITSAPDDPDYSTWCAESMQRTLKTGGLTFSCFRLLDRRNFSKARHLVSHSDFIVLGGGHVPTQNRFFVELGLRSVLASFDGVVMGISAGSMNCADIVYAQPEEQGESVDPNYHRFLPGLGLTKTQILPHYQKVCHSILDGRRLFEDITYNDSYGHTFYVFIDGSYLIRENGLETVHGECWRLSDGVMTKICEACGKTTISST